jgi:Holliday junction resolvasome RuvABC endonuclease subunit
VRLLAIDPSTNKVGLAFFEFGKLCAAFTLTATATERRFRQQELIGMITEILDENPVDHVSCEDPFLQGAGNKGMQRFIGALETSIDAPFTYYAPTSVKKAMGSGKLSKLEMALAAGEMLATNAEQELLAELINKEDFDATDAVAIGLAFLRGGSKTNANH